MRSVLPYVVLLILGIVIGWLYRDNYHHKAESIVQRDTIIYRDTVRQFVPVEKKVKETETIFVEVSDTIRIKDTLFVALPFEKKFYKEDDYYAEVSGYKCTLDYIEVYPKTITLTTTETIVPKFKKNSFSIGVEASYSDAFRMPIQAEYGYKITPHIVPYGYVEYETLTKQVGVGVGVHFSLDW